MPAASATTIAWSPAGSVCGRSVDQWAMGGLSIPSGEMGLLAPCATDDRANQAGPWTTSYTSAPFSRPETLAGPIGATVYVSSTTPDAELVAEVEQVTPNGTSYPLTEGALLGSLRALDPRRSWSIDGTTLLPFHPYTQQSAAPMPVGKVTELHIEIFPTLSTIAAGDRLRLTLATADTPHLTPGPGDIPRLAGGLYTIHQSRIAPSSLDVDLIG
jgi:predicted acyl esterase